jgi:hypothetical protein
MRITQIGKKIAMTMQALVLAFGFTAGSLALAGPALAAGTCDTSLTDPINQGAACSQPAGTSGNLFGAGSIFSIISNTLVFLVGAISVIFLIIGGLRYVISNGDSKNVEAAKNTILYAIIGIVIAIIAYALVNFVITTLGKATG